jgi:hypothetical protein
MISRWLPKMSGGQRKVNDIAEDKKVPALLTLLGGKTYTLLRNLTAPNKTK